MSWLWLWDALSTRDVRERVVIGGRGQLTQGFEFQELGSIGLVAALCLDLKAILGAIEAVGGLRIWQGLLWRALLCTPRLKSRHFFAGQLSPRLVSLILSGVLCRIPIWEFPKVRDPNIDPR